jgi:formate dehydrogenase
MATQLHHTFCRICEASCGLEVEVERGRIVQIRPDAAHVATGGYACVKGLKQARMYDSPDRLRQPLARVNGELRPVSWERAIAEIGDKVRSLRETHGPDAIAMYVGTAAGFGVLHPTFAQGFMTGVGSRNFFSSATQDCANKFAVARQMYGFPFIQPFPDLERTQCLIVVGANPAVSKWSFLQVPDPAAKLRALEARGAKLFIVDPRRTETAKAAGTWVPIRPNTDPFFYLGFLHELFAIGAVDRTRAHATTQGLAAIEALVQPWAPERCAEVTGIPAATLRELVQAYARADGAALYCSTGVNMGRHGSLGFWLQECIQGLTGNLDRAGGTLVGQGVIDFPAFGVKTGTLMRDDRSRVGGLPAVNDAFPGGILADEILTPGPGQIRALFVTGGNPLLTMANGARLREAFAQLDLLVCLDIQLSETAHVATHVLPTTSPLQRPDLPFIFPLMLGLQHRPYLQATRAVVAPEGEQRDEATIYWQIAKAAGVPLFGSRALHWLLDVAHAVHAARHPGQEVGLPQEGLLDTILRLCRQPRFRALLAQPHGVRRPDHVPGSFLGKRVLTADGKVELAPAPLLEAAAGLEAFFAEELRERGTLKLITKRQVTTHNSWTHNLEDFTRAGTNHLYVHPDDAARLGLVEGELADVRTATAVVRLPVRCDADLTRGTVALPHGWGHQHAPGQRIASRTRGVNVNLLAADGPAAVEAVSGMAHLTGFRVDVRPATGPQAATWSGVDHGSAVAT